MRYRNCTPIIKPLDVALACAAKGWAVFPCHVVLPNSGGCTCGDEHCATPARHAVVANGELAATTDVECIQQWWQRWPRANVAIRTGQQFDIVVMNPGTSAATYMRIPACVASPTADHSNVGLHGAMNVSQVDVSPLRCLVQTTY